MTIRRQRARNFTSGRNQKNREGAKLAEEKGQCYPGRVQVGGPWKNTSLFHVAIRGDRPSETAYHREGDRVR